jgi:hypothetical protein
MQEQAKEVVKDVLFSARNRCMKPSRLKCMFEC